MIASSAINEILGQWNSPIEVGEFTIVPTFSMYPSNSIVQIYIAGGGDRFVVSDGGGAMKVLSQAGAIDGSGKKTLSDFTKGIDVKVNDSGWLYMPGVPLVGLTSAISVVADFSREAAIMLLKHFNPSPIVDFRQEVHAALEQRFKRSLSLQVSIPGASNKLHKFDYFIRLNDNHEIAIDAVVPESSSINAAVVSHMDVKAAHRPNLKQYIVYNDEQKWKSSDLNLLDLGAPAIAFSGFSRAIERLVA